MLTRKHSWNSFSEGESQAGKKQSEDEVQEEECTGKSRPQLCVLSVATAVSGSEEHKSHRGELSGSAREDRAAE